MQYSLTFPTGTVKYIFQTRFEELKQLIDTDDCILLIDSRVAELYRDLFTDYRNILIDADEQHKSLAQVEFICGELMGMKAHRGTTLVGIGGGITSDITGFVASVYMRGISFGFVPTTLLAMTDAAIGGKNGVNFNMQKNMVGTIQQPSFILFDTQFLETLSDEDRSNGFAEVIKYACLFDKPLFEELEQHDPIFYRDNPEAQQLLIERCVDWKNQVVLSDEKEGGKRKLLNFGHTAGHPIETLHALPHGFAVAIGMMIACNISEQECGLSKEVTARLGNLLEQYGLPVSAELDIEQIMEVLEMDKKRNNEGVNYILLKGIGEAIVKPLPFDMIRHGLENYTDAGSN